MKTPSHKNQTRRKKPRQKRDRRPTQGNWPVVFPEVAGKTIEYIKLYLRVDDSSLSMAFTDKTHLTFDLEPGLTVRADYADMKTGNWRGIKRWPRYHSDSFWLSEPGPPPER